MEIDLPFALGVSRATGYGALGCLALSLGLSLWGKGRARRWWGMRSAELAVAHGLWGVFGFLGGGAVGWRMVLAQPYLRLGLVAAVLSVALWLTSWVSVRREMGPAWWGAWHRLVYPTAVAGVAHALLAPFGGTVLALFGGVVVAVLLVLRLVRG